MLFSEIIIAAWLHDVGKFAEVAGITELGNDSEKSKAKHTAYTKFFLKKYKNVLPEGLSFENISETACGYYESVNFDAQIVFAADCLASGCNKSNAKEFDGGNKQLIHLLSVLQTKKENAVQTAFCQIAPLEKENIIPTKENKNIADDYKKLWKCFEDDFQKLAGLDEEQFLLALSSLFERYLWSVPSGDANSPSLYQHAKMSAAIAGSLYRFHEAASSENEDALWDMETKKFHFINGDVSGIQKYIFDLKTTKDNAKLLRAKSFQLWALSEVISQYICRQFDVSPANIITSAGGKFLVLVPETENIETHIVQLQLDIEKYFLSEFAGHLAVIISDGVTASAKDLQKENAQKLFNSIGFDADKCKQKKMQKALQKEGQVLKENYSMLQQNGECPRCGIFPLTRKFADGDENAMCENCSTLVDIGGKLVREPALVNLNIADKELLPFDEMVRVKYSEKGFGYTVNEFSAGKPVMYLPYAAPWNEKSSHLKTFEEIAACATGTKKLAMFKADIDNLGFIFSSSLGDKFSFTNYTDLSHFLHYFFSAYYAYFVENGNGGNYRDKIYTVFSGGDDLCVLGAWNDVLNFAFDFHKELERFTNNNPSVTISGGITLVNPNVPVRNIASEAEEHLEMSKQRKVSEKIVKNAVTVFSTTVSWEDYGKCLEDGKWLKDEMEAANLSTGVVYRMIDFADRGNKIKEGNVSELLKMRNGIWKSNLRYMAARNIKDKNTRERFLKLGENEDAIYKSRIAVSYALYAKREN